LTLLRSLLQCLISNPALAKELPVGLLDQGSPEARALFAAAEFCREHPDTDGNIVIDHFQTTEFCDLLEWNQAALLEKKLETEDLEKEFRDALGLLQEKQGRQRIETLRVKQDRTAEEEAEMLRLLRERKQGPANVVTDAIMSGSRSTP
jgi:DNA-binding NarL/FixJ family response regulator